MTTISPWLQEPDIARTSYAVSLETLRICGICIQPFIPSTAARLLDALGVPPHERTWEFATPTGFEDPSEIRQRGQVGLITRGVKLF